MEADKNPERGPGENRPVRSYQTAKGLVLGGITTGATS